MKKINAIGIFFLLIGTNAITSALNIDRTIDDKPIKMIKQSYKPLINSGNILFVGGLGPGNYSKIQDAINDSSDGDMVFVFNDSSPYFENIIIYKSINLIGENRESTFINGNFEGDVVNISADYVKISGFTIRYSGNYYAGIIVHSNYNVIEENTLSSNSDGIFIKSSQDNIITGNFIGSGNKDIYLSSNSDDNIIDDNILLGGWVGIYVIDSCDRNIYSNNTVTDCYQGIGILDSSDSIILSNIVQDNKYGMGIENANNSIISENTIIDNEESGFSIYESVGNIISNNTFENDGFFIKKSYKNTVFNNTVNDLPLVYLEDEAEIIVPNGSGQIVIVNCNKITIQNQIISNTNYAVELYNSEECNISNNILSNNDKDIYLGESNNNEIVNNIVNGRDFFSISLYNSNSNNISENTLNGILDLSAIFLEYSNNNNISRNILTNNSMISILRSNENSVIRNIVPTGSGHVSLGHISLRVADNNKIIGNTITSTSSSLGLTIISSDNNLISENTITNRDCGIIMEKSNSNTISRNDITYNDQGISLEDSKYNKILKNNFIGNKEKDASCIDSIPSQWRRNYWGKFRILPKLIPGKINIYRDWPMPPIVIPIPSIDLFPAKVPYDI